ncbi:MAG: thiamine pyrophosphate-requiring protein [Candidatus Bathyarchaeia archaeon]
MQDDSQLKTPHKGVFEGRLEQHTCNTEAEQKESIAQVLVETLTLCGIKYWFVNSGTEWPPFMEAVSKIWAKGSEWPKIIICPHEFTATSMAHGYAMVSGDIPLVGYHGTVGTYNALGAIANAFTAHVPLLLLAGSGWITEKIKGPPAQGSRDQAAPLREYIKWDCEVKLGEQIPYIVQRALQIAKAEPPGPVYITIPNEVALMRITRINIPSPNLYVPPTTPRPDPSAIMKAAELLVKAENPVIVVDELGRRPAAVRQLMRLAELLAIPVNGALKEFGYMNFPPDHPLSVSAPLEDADVIFMIESPYPSDRLIPNPQAKYINLAIDPLYMKFYPLSGFRPANISIFADPAEALAQLYRASLRLLSKNPARRTEIGERFKRIREAHNAQVNALIKEALSVRDKKPIDRRWINYCIGLVKNEDDIILINNYGYMYQGSGRFIPGTYFGTPPSACLGWGLGAALGAKLAAPDKTVIACMGDGSYIYGNPVAAHLTSKKYNLPFLTIIYNNQGWGVPHRILLQEYPEGWAVRYGYVKALSGFEPSLDFTSICKAAGGYAETVEDPSEVQPALKRALKAVSEEGRQALLNFILSFGE